MSFNYAAEGQHEQIIKASCVQHVSILLTKRGREPFQLQIPATIEELQGVVADQSEVSQKFS